MNLVALIKGLGVFTLAHSMVWFQLNGQFFSDWFKNNMLVTVLFGIPISYLYIIGTRLVVEGFDGLLWPARFIGFAICIGIYALGVNYFFKEGINAKTLVSLVLCILLIAIQVFWKTK